MILFKSVLQFSSKISNKSLYPLYSLKSFSFRQLAKFYSSDLISRYHYHEECEESVNKQINLELYAGYVYLGMAYYFNRCCISLNGFYSMFLQFSKEEVDHAKKLMDYQNLRGGTVMYCDVKAPENCNWSPTTAVHTAAEMEKHVTKSLLELHELACKHNDPHFSDFLESIYFQEQYESINKLCHLSAKLKRVGNEVGLHLLDKELERQFSKNKNAP